MDTIQILQSRGDRTDPARIRIVHQNRVLDTGTVLSFSALPLNASDLTYPPVLIERSPPVRCFLYDWLQYINLSLQYSVGNLITSKEQQTKNDLNFDVSPRNQAAYCEVVTANFVPVYSDLPAQTNELYALINDLLKQPTPVFEDQALVTAFRVTEGGDQRATVNGDVRVAVINTQTVTDNIPLAA